MVIGMRSVGLGCLLLIVAGCADLRVHDRDRGRPVALTLCSKNETLQQRSTVYFGASIASGGEVDDAQWTRFLADEVSARFPDGLTWFTAAGQWRGDAGAMVREQSRVLMLIHDGKPEQRRAIDAIVATYRTRFAQEAVLEDRQAICMNLHRAP